MEGAGSLGRVTSYHLRLPCLTPISKTQRPSLSTTPPPAFHLHHGIFAISSEATSTRQTIPLQSGAAAREPHDIDEFISLTNLRKSARDSS